MNDNKKLEALFLQSRIKHEQGQFESALKDYRKLQCILPENHALTGLIGVCLTQKDLSSEAIPFLQRAISLAPEHAASRLNLGNALRDPKDPNPALKCHRSALILQPNLDEAFNNRATILLEMSQFDQALVEIERALALTPLSPLFLMNKGSILRRLKKMTPGLASFDLSIRLKPDSPEAYLNRSFLHQDLMHYEEALRDYRIAIALDPKLETAYLGLGNSLHDIRLYREAGMAYERAWSINDSCTNAITAMIICMEKILEWDRVDQLLTLAEEYLQKMEPIGSPFPLLSASDDPTLHKSTADEFIKLFKPTIKQAPTSRCRKDMGKIRLGYFSSDFREHPVYLNLRPMLAHHDRDTFEIFAFDFSPESAAFRDGLFDHVLDIKELDDASAAQLSRSLNIDIAIDLNGHTQFARTGIFANRAAPIQINYLGYPGTMGGDSHDYIIADHYVIPKEREQEYSEKVARLPSFFMPYDFTAGRSKVSPSTTRTDYGLPENKFVFCSFNELSKVSRDIFLSWATILRSSPDSVLWIAPRGGVDLNEIKSLFASRGVHNSRIISADRVDSLREHIERLQHADLMLDTFPYNSHTTACDAVSAGLPLITISGKSFASRVSGSLLSGLGLSELVLPDHLAYEQKAIELAEAPAALNRIKLRLMENREKMRSLDIFAGQMEELLTSLLNP